MTPVDKVLVTERYRGSVSRQSYRCGSCGGPTTHEARFCETCGERFRAGYREEVVTR